MVTVNQLLMILAGLLGMVSYSTAFWFAAEEPKSSSPRVLYQPSQDYYRQYMPPPLPYSIPLPLPAHLSPAAVQNVQLVPCLCPVTQEYSYDNSQQDYGSRKPQYVHSQPQPAPQQRRK